MAPGGQLMAESDQLKIGTYFINLFGVMKRVRNNAGEKHLVLVL